MSDTSPQEPEGSRRNIILGYEVVKQIDERLARIEERQETQMEALPLLRHNDAALELRVRTLELAVAVLQTSTNSRDSTTAKILGYVSTIVTIGLAVFVAFFKHA